MRKYDIKYDIKYMGDYAKESLSRSEVKKV